MFDGDLRVAASLENQVAAQLAVDERPADSVFTDSKGRVWVVLQGGGIGLIERDGTFRVLRAGDRFVIPAGFKGTWEVLEPCRKIYVMFEQK